MAKPLNRVFHNGKECKICPCCTNPVHIENYGTRQRSGKQHLDTYCRDCHSTKQRERYTSKAVLTSDQLLELQRTKIKKVQELNNIRWGKTEDNKKGEHPVTDAPLKNGTDTTS